jgi:hypothetical protein
MQGGFTRVEVYIRDEDCSVPHLRQMWRRAGCHIDGHLYAVVGVNAFDGVEPSLIGWVSATFEGESKEARLARRKRNWIANVEYVEIGKKAEDAMTEIPKWHVKGDWFDVYKCNVPCPCTFAQSPSYGDCEGILAYHIREGHYGDISLAGLNLIGVGGFEGNIWDGKTKAKMGFFIDERADQRQREALQMIWGGQAGGFPAVFARLIGRCVESSLYP